jgi:hypothetical protein
LLHAIKVVLRDEFNADRAALCLALPAAARWRIAAEFLCPEVVAVFEELFRGGQPQCGRLRPEQGTFLFGDSAPPVASAALIPLGTGDWRGMLALGSWDPERFHSGVGTLFLGRVGELVSQALQARLLPGHRKVNFHAAS